MHPNLLVLRTLSKWAGLAGLRVGYMVAQPAIIEVVKKVKQPYSVSVAAEVAAPGGVEAVQLRVAEQYVDRFGELAKAANTLVVPANLSDVGSMIATAMSVIKATGKGSTGSGLQG